MEQTYMTSVHIHKVRNLHNIDIPLAAPEAFEKKHLILTGKNGSGKTSMLEALVSHLEYITSNNFCSHEECEKYIDLFSNNINKCANTEEGNHERLKNQKILDSWQNQFTHWTDGATADFTSIASLREKYANGDFILAYFSDSRVFEVIESKNIEKIELQSVYKISESPSRDFSKYLVNLKTKQSFAQTEGKYERANEIKTWFERFTEVLRDLYDEPNLALAFDIETSEFNILIDGREPFDFNTMSKGYSAVFDIICDLIMRMESKNSRNLEGIVLIDEIETHLHVELQKKIMPTLTKLFPNIQFILTTHSPFILSSVENAAVYDLEKKTLVTEGLTNLPYSGIVEGYFDTKETSAELQSKLDEYRVLSGKPDKTIAEKLKMLELETDLEEIPDFLALDIATEYQRLKLEAKR